MKFFNILSNYVETYNVGGPDDAINVAYHFQDDRHGPDGIKKITEITHWSSDNTSLFPTGMDEDDYAPPDDNSH